LVFLNISIKGGIDKIFHYDCQYFDKKKMDKESYFTKGKVKLLDHNANASPANVGAPSRFIRSYTYVDRPTKKVNDSPCPSPLAPAKLILNNNNFNEINLELAACDGNIDSVAVVNPTTVQNNFINEEDQVYEVQPEVCDGLAQQVKVTLHDYKSLKVKDFQYDKRSFLVYLRDELIVHHRLLSIVFKRSLISPIYLRLNKLIFELSMTFALSAMLFNDTLIDNRAEDSQNVTAPS
jgi:hypothetical protein